MIPDYKCRSRQKTNKRKLVANTNPSERLHFPKGIEAGILNMHIDKDYRRYVKHRTKHPHISNTAILYYIPNGYNPFPF